MRARPGDVATGVAAAAATVVVAARPPYSGVGTAWTIGALVLGIALCAAARVIRRGDGPRTAAARTAAWVTALGGSLLGLAVLEAAVDRDPALAVLDLPAVDVVFLLVLPGLVLTFPTGRLDGPVERTAAAVVLVCGAVQVAGPGGSVALAAQVAQATVAAGVIWARFERTRGVERERILWLLLGGGLVAVVDGHLLFVGGFVAPDAAVPVLVVGLLVMLVVPVTLVVAMRAPRAVDVRALIARVAASVVMVDLTFAVVAGTLAGIEVATGRAPHRVAVSVVCLLVAACFHPAWRMVRQTLDQVLFGGRPNPVEVVTTLGDQLRRGGGPQEWLEALRGAVALPYAELRRDGEVLAVSGHPDGPGATVALLAGDDHVGDLVVGLPEHHRTLPRATDAVLRTVAGPLARALQSARLEDELKRSRRMVVLAAEEERRRLRRDLHDGLGTVLAGVAYNADAARNMLDVRHERAGEVLADLRSDVTGAIAEVRRIVHDLRPPVLDQFGLVEALRQRAARISHDGGPAVGIQADDVGPLPAAVEVAAFRVVTEAVLNVARHASAGSVAVRVRRTDVELDLLIVDDGAGRVPWTPGVGLASMRERLEQLGGTLEAGPTPAGGRVHALLPVPREPG